MEKQILKAHYLGSYSFKSKDKTKDFYKLQAVVFCDGSTRALLVDTFVTKEEQEKLLNLQVFDNIDLQVNLNLSTGKIGYKLLF